VIVDSSWIDMLAGAAKSSICSVPPLFCAKPGFAKEQPKRELIVIASRRRFRVIIRAPQGRSRGFPICADGF
jgi:hypothetical protein